MAASAHRRTVGDPRLESIGVDSKIVERSRGQPTAKTRQVGKLSLDDPAGPRSEERARKSPVRMLPEPSDEGDDASDLRDVVGCSVLRRPGSRQLSPLRD